MSVRGDFGKLAAWRQSLERATKITSGAAQRAAPELSSPSISFSAEGANLMGTMPRRFPSSWRAGMPAAWRAALTNAARDEFLELMGGQG